MFNVEQMKHDQDSQLTTANFGQANLATNLKTLATKTASALHNVEDTHKTTIDELTTLSATLSATIGAQQKDIDAPKRTSHQSHKV